MRTLLWLPFAFVIACGGSSSSSTDAGTDASNAPATVHRAVAAACPTDRPAGNPPSIQGTCKADSECTQGTNGRCTSVALGAPKCTYDACGSDKDCGSSAGVCQCRAASEGGANACRQGNCRTDGDCGVVGKGFCSPSAVEIDVYCRFGVPVGSFGYFCHTPADECVNDAECGSAVTGACIFDVPKQHWVCQQLQCTD